jgi:hypothetical protein
MFTWANNQENLVMAAVDKVFITTLVENGPLAWTL